MPACNPPDAIAFFVLPAVMEDAHMSEQSSEKLSPSGKLSGWLKAGMTTVLGLLSGAVLTYLSPLINNAVKPPKPLANFEYQANGLEVTFQNRCSGGHDGWWDFGDGSALQPFVTDQPSIKHVYGKPGNYTVKLALRNLIDEENDRSITVALEPADAAPPVIETFEVVPVRGDYAPATFRVVSKVKGADLCVWAVSDRVIEFSPETANGSQEERFVTFKEPGSYLVKLAVWNGKHAVERSETVAIKKPPTGTVVATIAVTYEAVLVEHRTDHPLAQIRFPAEQKGDSHKFTKHFGTAEGWDIIKADLAQPVKDPNVKVTAVQISPDKKTATVTGELVKPADRNAPLPAWNCQLVLTQQRQPAVKVKKMEPMAINVTVPGTTLVPLPPLPSKWEVKNHKITLTLEQDGKHFTWKEGEMPHNATVQMSSSAMSVTAIEQGNQVRLELAEVNNSLSLFGK
jgi:PKD repeat protein